MNSGFTVCKEWSIAEQDVKELNEHSVTLSNSSDKKGRVAGQGPRVEWNNIELKKDFDLTQYLLMP